LNHYITRSYEETFEKKTRGCAWNGGEKKVYLDGLINDEQLTTYSLEFMTDEVKEKINYYRNSVSEQSIKFPDISIVIVSNNDKKSEQVRKNIYRTCSDKENIEIIIKDGSSGKGICELYNEAITECTGKYIVFQHNDVFYLENNWDKIIQEKFNLYNDLKLLGVAGATEYSSMYLNWGQIGSNKMFGKIIHYTNKEYFKSEFNTQDGDHEVVVMDGLWLCLKKDYISEITFDEYFDKYHFYDISLCLRIPNNKIVTTDIKVLHTSLGSFNNEWEKESLKIYEIYGNSFLFKVKNNLTTKSKQIALNIEKVLLPIELMMPIELKAKKLPLTIDKEDKPIIENNIVEKKPKQLLKYSVNPSKNQYAKQIVKINNRLKQKIYF